MEGYSLARKLTLGWDEELISFPAGHIFSTKSLQKDTGPHSHMGHNAAERGNLGNKKPCMAKI